MFAKSTTFYTVMIFILVLIYSYNDLILCAAFKKLIEQLTIHVQFISKSYRKGAISALQYFSCLCFPPSGIFTNLFQAE